MHSSKDRLDLEQNDQYQQWEWRIQRVGWTLWLGVIVAGLVGLIGTGPLSTTHVSSPDGTLRVTYDGYVHLRQTLTLAIQVRSNPGQEGNFRLMVSQKYLDGIEIHRIQPEPIRSEIGQDGVLFVFDRQPGTTEGEIVMHLEHEVSGTIQARIALEGGQAVEFSQFVYP
jgi:hypothetical protein